MLLSFDSQFCFLPLCLVSCSPVRNFNYFCICLSFYLFFFVKPYFCPFIPGFVFHPFCLVSEQPLLSARVCGNASLYLYMLYYIVYSWNNFDEAMILVAWDWGFSVSDLRELSRSVLPVWKWLCHVMPCYADVPIDWKSFGQISPSFLTLLKPWG